MQVNLRDPKKVLNLHRMGSYHQTRLSFMRSLLRLAHREKWQYKKLRWQMDDKGVGHAVYEMQTPHGVYSLLAFSHDLPDDMRSDRVIATAWDATFALLQGKVTDEDIVRLQDNVPKQEAGRVSEKELCLSRANRSVRLWEVAQDALANGRQPAVQDIEEVGYLMRTTAVYGNAKFGTATRFGQKTAPQESSVMTAPFRMELLTVWLIRNFSFDLLDYKASLQGGDKSVKLSPELRQKLGIGNSTGLGMAPFVVNHPLLTHSWVNARESALAQVLERESCDKDWQDMFFGYCEKAYHLVQKFSSSHDMQIEKNKNLRKDMEALQNYLPKHDWQQIQPCQALYDWSESHLSAEGQEMLVSLLIECADDIEDFCDSMGKDESADFFIDGSMALTSLQKILHEKFAWVGDIDFSDKDSRGQFWYVSEEKLEPRLGKRYEEEGADLEQPLGIAYGIHCMQKDLQGFSDSARVADFLLVHPEHRFSVRRVLLLHKYPYGEIHDNILSSDMMPIDILRFKLSFFGATNFDPRSDRWVRITMYQGAPFPQDIATASAEAFNNWVYNC